MNPEQNKNELMLILIESIFDLKLTSKEKQKFLETKNYNDVPRLKESLINYFTESKKQ